MPFCSNCGTEVEPGIKFCPNCGAAQTMVGTAAPGSGVARFKGVSRPTPVVAFVLLYLILGLVLLFLGVATLFLINRADVVALGTFVFLANGALALLTVYGFLRRGRWAPRYIALTGLWSVVGGGILAISFTIILLAVGALAIVVGLSTLVYLRSESAKAYLRR